MFVVTTERLLPVLRDMQNQRCVYGTTEGDGRMCDCKYGWTPGTRNSEQTGCPELRQVIRTIEAQEGA